MSDARSDILDRIRSRRGATPPQLEINEMLAELGMAPPAPESGTDPVQDLHQQLLENHASVEYAANRAAAVKNIARHVYQSYNNYRVVAGNDPRLAAMPWRDGGVLVRFGAAAPQDQVAISYSLLGVVESGSLALFSSRHNPGSNNWLAQDHIVLCDAADIVADYEHAWRELRQRQTALGSPRGIHFISGPSATADIGFQMVFGAHGPQRLHVIIIGAPEATPTEIEPDTENKHETI